MPRCQTDGLSSPCERDKPALLGVSKYAHRVGNNKRVCVFCGATPLTNEHVWPRWVRQLPGPAAQRKADTARTPHIITRTRDLGDLRIVYPEFRGQRVPVTDVTVRVACAACNGGWMSQLEGRSKPLLTSLTAGAPVQLDTVALGTLAAWAFKTAAMFQFHDAKTRTIALDELAQFRAQGVPIGLTRVFIFRADTGTNAMRLSNIAATVIRQSHVGPVPEEPNVSTTMMVLDRVGLVVAHSTTWDADPHPKFPGLRQIWPFPKPMTWPTPAITDDAIEAISNFLPRG